MRREAMLLVSWWRSRCATVRDMALVTLACFRRVCPSHLPFNSSHATVKLAMKVSALCASVYASVVYLVQQFSFIHKIFYKYVCILWSYVVGDTPMIYIEVCTYLWCAHDYHRKYLWLQQSLANVPVTKTLKFYPQPFSPAMGRPCAWNRISVAYSSIFSIVY